MTKTLLMDAFPIRLSLEEDGTGKVIARGEFGRADLATQNGRVYPRAIYEREVRKLGENIAKRRVFGELDHPADGKTKLSRASHVITGLKLNSDGIVMGEAEILDTPAGRTLKAILSAGAEVGVSSRGFGSTSQASSGSQVVGEDFVLRTFDFVADPAMKTAYPSIVAEDVQEVFCHTSLETSFPELAEELRKDERDKVESALRDMLDIEREKAKNELRDEFGRKLTNNLETMREDVATEVRTQLCEDPEVAGAKAVLQTIAGMVADYQGQTDPDTKAMKDALKAKDLEVSKISEELVRVKDVARQAILRAQVEQSIGGHPRHESIRELIGDPTKFEGLEEIVDRIDSIKSEMSGLDDEVNSKAVVEALEQLEQKDEEIDELSREAKKLRKAVNSLQNKLNKAIDIGEEYKERAEEASELAEEASMRAYKTDRSSGYTNSSKLMNLLEGIDDTDAVDRIVKTSGRRTMRDASLDTVRNRLRGAVRDAPEALNESKNRQVGPESIIGNMSMSDYRSLAGINNKR